MMGHRAADQAQFFYAFNLDDLSSRILIRCGGSMFS
jgi:hypothetical protein